MPDHPDRSKENEVFRQIQRAQPGNVVYSWTLVKSVVYLLNRLRRLERRVRELEGD
jgi:hypothetical protein